MVPGHLPPGRLPSDSFPWLIKCFSWSKSVFLSLSSPSKLNILALKHRNIWGPSLRTEPALWGRTDTHPANSSPFKLSSFVQIGSEGPRMSIEHPALWILYPPVHMAGWCMQSCLSLSFSFFFSSSLPFVSLCLNISYLFSLLGIQTVTITFSNPNSEWLK